MKAVGQDRLGDRVGNIRITSGQCLLGVWKGGHLKMTAEYPIGQLGVYLSSVLCSTKLLGMSFPCCS